LAGQRRVEASDLKPLVDRTFAFESAPAAYHHLKSGDHMGKLLISFDPALARQ